MKDQAIEVVSEVSQGEFSLSPGDANGADEQTEPVLMDGPPLPPTPCKLSVFRKKGRNGP
jgi:hypothetical protein